MMGAEGTKIFDFDNPRSLEKALSGKELYRKLLLKSTKSTKTDFFWALIPHKRYQNTSGFVGGNFIRASQDIRNRRHYL